MSEKPKVLVADEDKDIRFLIRMYLRDYDIHFIEARDGEECLQLIKKEKPQFVILNYMLGKLTGYQVAKKTSEDETLKSIPVIIMTLEGFDLTEHKAGVNDYLAKPFNRKQFMEVVKKTAGHNLFKNLKKHIESPSHSKPVIFEDVKEEKSGTGIRKKILIADDEVSIVKLLEFTLGKDYDLDVVYTGDDLVEKAKSRQYDLIISDVVMPKLSGWKSIKKVRENGCNTPVIFNSGMVKDKELYETLKPEGPSRFMLKPFEIEDLRSLVKEMLGL